MDVKVKELLASFDRRVTFFEFMMACAERGIYPVFRAMGMSGVRLVDSHNQKYT